MKTRYGWWLAAILFAAYGSATTAEELVFGGCEATASLEYFQRGAEADIKATVDNPDCAASSGTFVVELTIRADGETQSVKLRFEERWQRDDDRPFIVEKRYPIGNDVDLLRARIRKLSCDCADDEAAPPGVQSGT